MHPCRICDVEIPVSTLGKHYREKHKIAVHGAERRLPDHYVTALCDGHVNALKLIQAEADQYLSGQ